MDLWSSPVLHIIWLIITNVEQPHNIFAQKDLFLISHEKLLVALKLIFLIKIVCNQFLLLKNYRLWHWIRSFIWFIPTNLESVIFDYPTSHKIPIAVESVETFKVWNEKGSVKKRKASNNRSRFFKIALEGGKEWKDGGTGNFASESFNH